jgi:uncharacterized membrane protein (UPF0127 family)
VTGRPCLAALLAATLLTGCTADDAEPSAAPPSSASPSVGQRIAQTVGARLDGVALELEVADEPQERSVGLMGRTDVPPGTGMVFLFDEPVSTSFYMFQVPVPLVAVFVRNGVVVGVERMEPCAEADPDACPLYGPDESYDTVVETAPETLPDVRAGDRLELTG